MNFKNILNTTAWGYQLGWAMILLTTLILLLIFRWRVDLSVFASTCGLPTSPP